LIGRLTSEMTQLHMLTSHQSRKLFTLRMYLRERAISKRLAVRIHRSALHTMKDRGTMAQAPKEIFSLVSEPLLAELDFELFAPCFGNHSLFSNMVVDIPEIMSRICRQAMSVIEVTEGDQIFHVGEKPQPPKMYIVCSGLLKYINVHGNVKTATAGSFVAEVVLWVAWTHVGLFMANEDSRLHVLDAEKFQQIAKNFALSFLPGASDPHHYAATFVSAMNEAPENERDDFLTISTTAVGRPSLTATPFWRRQGRMGYTVTKGLKRNVRVVEYFLRAKQAVFRTLGRLVPQAVRSCRRGTRSDIVETAEVPIRTSQIVPG